MAQNMAAQDKFVELMMLLFGGAIDKIITLKEFADKTDEIEKLSTALYDSLDTKIATASPAEAMLFQALKVVSRNDPGHEPVFDCKYYADKFEKNAGFPLTTAIMENDNYSQEQKEQLCNLINSLTNEKQTRTLANGEVEEYYVSQCFTIESIEMLATSLTPYMNEENQKGFNAVIENIKANRTGDKKTDMEYVRNLFQKGEDDEENKFTTIFRAATDKEKYAKNVMELSEGKTAGIMKNSNAALNDMNFAAIQNETDREKIVGLRAIMDKVHAGDLLKKNKKLFDVGKFGLIHIGTEMIDINKLYKTQVAQEDIIKANDQLQKQVDIKKSKDYQKDKQEKRENQKGAEAAKAEKERCKNIDEQVKAAKDKAEEIKTEIETNPIYKDGLGKKELDRIDNSLTTIESLSRDAKANKEGSARFIFSDTKNPEVRNEIKQWTSDKYSNTKTINEFVTNCESVSAIKDSALEAKDACLTSFRFNRSDKVKTQMEKVVRDNSMSLATTVESLQDSKFEENQEETTKQIAQLKTVVDERRDFVNASINSLKEYERGIVNSDTMFACNVFLNDDMKKMEEFLVTAPKEEVEKAFEKLDYIEKNELLAVTKTRERALLFVEKRQDRNTLNITEKKEPKNLEPKVKDNALQRERTNTDN